MLNFGVGSVVIAFFALKATFVLSFGMEWGGGVVLSTINNYLIAVYMKSNFKYVIVRAKKPVEEGKQSVKFFFKNEAETTFVIPPLSPSLPSLPDQKIPSPSVLHPKCHKFHRHAKQSRSKSTHQITPLHTSTFNWTHVKASNAPFTSNRVLRRIQVKPPWHLKHPNNS